MMSPKPNASNAPIPKLRTSNADRHLQMRLSLQDIPIPCDAQVSCRWSTRMHAITKLVGAYETLLICDAFGGREIYIPRDPKCSPFRELIRDESVEKLSLAFGLRRLAIPLAASAIHFAKRQNIIASVRCGKVSTVVAASILGTARRHLSRIINSTDEGIGFVPIDFPEPRSLAMLRDAAQIAADEMREAGLPSSKVRAITAKMLGVFFQSADPLNGAKNV